MPKNTKKTRIIIGLVILALLIYAGISFALKGNQPDPSASSPQTEAKTVKTMIIGQEINNQNSLKTAGVVVPENQIDVVALSQGTAKSVLFNVGDYVDVGQTLVYLDSNNTQTSFLNAQINYTNMISNLESVKRSTDETVRQAELGVQSAEKTVNSAEIALKTAQDSYDNSLNLQDKREEDTIDNVIIVSYGYLNSIKTALDQINYIIHAEDGAQLANIAEVLSVKDSIALNTAKKDYLLAKDSYSLLSQQNLDKNNIQENLSKIVNLLEDTKNVVDETIITLDNTITSASFSATELSAQKTSFNGLRSSVVAAFSQAKTSLNSLENLDLTNKQELDGLTNALNSAENQLKLAKLAYNNSLISLNSAKQAQQQQIIVAQSSLDNALGQLNLNANQISDLSIKAAIRGQIVKKYIDLGAEITPGQKIAEIAQTETVKVEINLSSEDIYRIKLGQTVKINEALEGVISNIAPSADEITRKVKVEISFINNSNQLISGTFVDVEIPLDSSLATTKAIPLKAIIITQTEKYVFVNDNGVAKKVIVETGDSQGDFIQITQGLELGQELIYEGNRLLEEGENINVNN